MVNEGINGYLHKESLKNIPERRVAHGKLEKCRVINGRKLPALQMTEDKRHEGYFLIFIVYYTPFGNSVSFELLHVLLSRFTA